MNWIPLIFSTLSLFLSVFALVVQEREEFDIFVDTHDLISKIYIRNCGNKPLFIINITSDNKELKVYKFRFPYVLMPKDILELHEERHMSLFVTYGRVKFEVTYKLFGLIDIKQDILSNTRDIRTKSII